MVSRARLALAWPTYRRPEALAGHFDHLLDEAKRLGIPLYVSDDSPDEESEKVVRAAAARYPDVHYRRNSPSLGHDRNFVETLNWPDADYVWVLGDKLRPKAGLLEEILGFLDGQDLVFVNNDAYDHRQYPVIRDDEARAFIRDRLWHQTLTGTTIYHRRAREDGHKRTIWRNFPQVSIILDMASRDTVSIGWFAKSAIEIGIVAKSYWLANTVDVFVTDWGNVVSDYPGAIPPDQRSRVIRSHSLNRNLFCLPALAQLKLTGQFSRSSLRRPYFMDAMHLPRWKILAALAVPSVAYRLLKALRQPRG